MTDKLAEILRCAIYTRVSTEEQGRTGASLPEQLHTCRRHAAQQGWTIVEELQDIQSGLDTDRAAYQQAISLARARGIDVVLVWRLDRFGRDEAEAMLRLKEMARLQVRVVSATEGDQSPFLQRLMFLLAGEESRRTSERVRPALRRRAEEGLWMANPPFGYRMDPARPGRLVIDEAAAPIVREIFRRYACGTGAFSVSGWLNTLTRPDGSPLRSPKGRWFGPTFVSELLHNPVYVGMVRWNLSRHSKIDGRRRIPLEEQMLVPGQHEAIVERDLFDRVQAALLAGGPRTRRPRTRLTFLLTGLLTCGSCGRAVCGSRAYGKGRRTFSYRCNNHGHGSTPGGWLDRYVLRQVAALPVPDRGMDAIRASLEADAAMQPDRAGDLQAQRKRHEERRRRLTMHLADGVLTVDDYRAAIAEVEYAMATVDREMAALAPRTDAAALLADTQAWLSLARELGGGTLVAILPGAALEDQAAVVRAAVERITLTKGEQLPAITWRPWVESLRNAVGVTPC